MQVMVDPTGHFEGVAEGRLIEAVGILPHWAAQALRASESARVVFLAMVDLYRFGKYEFSGGEVDAQGVYRYPEDPPLYPILTLEHKGIKVHFYQHAMLAIVGEDETIVTRMD
jgi:hypothetical protein